MKKLLTFLLLLLFTTIVTDVSVYAQKSPSILKVYSKGESQKVDLPTGLKKPINTHLLLKQRKNKRNTSFYSPNINFTTQVKQRVPSTKSVTGTTFYGNLIASDTWEDFAAYEMPYGIYSFKSENNPVFTEEITSLGLYCNSGVYANGKFYGIHPALIFGAFNGVIYYVVDTETWTIESSQSLDVYTYDYMASCLTYDFTSNTIYAVRYNSDLTGLTWATMNENFEFTDLNAWNDTISLLAMTTLPNGTIYGVGEDGNLYTVDKSNGALTFVGNTGVTPAYYTQSIVYDGRSNKIVWNAVLENETGLYEIDIETGEATLLTIFENNEQFASLYCTEESALADAPAKISDLTLQYSTAGDTNGLIVCTIPSKTYQGADLSGNVTLETKLDGVSVDTKELAPGSSYELPFTTTSDNHIVTLLTSNSAGYSPVAVLKEFVGYDYPDSVNNLTYSIENGLAILDWDAATKGVNNGYINTDSLYYNVIRYPDNVIVASLIDSTNFVDTLPQLLNNYYYGIEPYNGKHKAGIERVTESYLFGNAYGVPFVSNFTNEEDIEFYNIIDGNNDDISWFWINSWLAYWGSNAEDKGDDWFVSPNIRLEKGKKYQLTFRYKGLYSPNTESMKVALGTSQVDTASFTQILFDEEIIDFYEFTDTAVDFSVSETKDYNIGFYAYSDKELCTGLYMNHFEVNLIGDENAPEGVSELAIVPDVNDELQATVYFTAPSKNLAGTNLETISGINIYRGSDMELLTTFTNVEPLSQVSYTDAKIAEPGIISYTVVAFNDLGNGRVMKDSAFVGMYPIPYEEHFYSASALNTYTLISSLEGANDWSFNEMSGNVETYHYADSVDNWLITPPIKFEDETIYQFNFNYSSYGFKTFDITLGQSNDPESHSKIGSVPNRPAFSTTPDSCMFTVANGGKYFLGVNVASGQNSIWTFDVFLDDFVITKVASAKSPAAITELNIITPDNGEPTADISFNAPEVTYAGYELDEITKISVFRDDKVEAVKVFEAPEVGSALSFTDNLVGGRLVVYSFVPENTYGMGEIVNDTVFVGMDTPGAVQNFTVKAGAENTNAVLSWEKPVGENDGYINYDRLTYNVFLYNESNEAFELLEQGLTTESYSYTGEPRDDMKVYYFAVMVMYQGEQKETAMGSVVLGKPYSLPFVESFPNMEMQTAPWMASVTDYSGWAVTSSNNIGIEPQDADSGLIVFVNYSTDEDGILVMPKMKLSDAQSNECNLSFWMFQDPTYFTQFSYAIAQISVNDGPFQAISDTLRLSDGAGWTKHTISLFDYKDADHIAIRFYAYSAFYYDVLFIDNIQVKNLYNHDLEALTLTGPDLIAIDQEGEFSLSVGNKGLQNADDFSVDFYCNNSLLESKASNELAMGDTIDFTFAYTPTVIEAGDTLSFKAVVNFSTDADTLNNTSNSIETYIVKPSMSGVIDLSGTLNESAVDLSWSQPENLTVTADTTDDFEAYESFIIENIGGFTTVDGDDQLPVSVNGTEYANQFEVQAFMVWNASAVGADGYEPLLPYSGDQCLIGWAASGVANGETNQTKERKNSDWLISPELVGGTVFSFMAAQLSVDYGMEQFEILTSNTNADTTSFTVLKAITLSTLDWEKIEVMLPVNAKYVAIHHITLNGFALKLDDITYTSVNGQTVELNLEGYNVFRNNEKINETLVLGTEYTDNLTTNGTYNYQVTTVYTEGESAPSNTVSIDYTTTGIESNSITFQAYGVNNALIIKSEQTQTFEIYNVLGVCVHTIEVSGTRKVVLSKGTYVVTSGDESHKIIVY